MPDQILIIEDDEVTRYAYERAFLKSGYRVGAFQDYFGAASAIDRGEGAILILDIQLPPRTPHGLSVARMVHARRPDLPLIFVSGHSEYASEIDGLGPLFLKPVDTKALVAAVRARLTE